MVAITLLAFTRNRATNVLPYIIAQEWDLNKRMILNEEWMKAGQDEQKRVVRC